jgi:hypothetical protein
VKQKKRNDNIVVDALSWSVLWLLNYMLKFLVWNLLKCFTPVTMISNMLSLRVLIERDVISSTWMMGFYFELTNGVLWRKNLLCHDARDYLWELIFIARKRQKSSLYAIKKEIKIRSWSPSPIQFQVSFRIQEQSTLKLMPMSDTTSVWGILGLDGNIRISHFQWDQSHIQLKPESTRIVKTSQVY